MRRFVAAAVCCLSGVVGGASRSSLHAQDSTTASARAQPPAPRTRGPAWNDPRTRALMELATRRRAQQLADTGLADYQATAHGYLTFLAQLGDGFQEPPKIVKADELALEVYWKAPNLSKQRIMGRRDTLLLPTDIQYHRDHLGIVQNNFPDIIRLGEGDEVRDVPHPLSPAGLGSYDFAIADSLRLTIPGRVIDVLQVKVRPKDDRLARLIGALFLDRETGQVVRMAFGFTRAAFLDKNLEDLSVVLENGLVGTRFWLPRRQEVEIRRTGTWLDYPVRGIIRGRWEIGDYQLNQGTPAAFFAGPEIVPAPRAEQQRHAWTGQILDSLPPDVRAVTDADVQRVQAEARALVRAQALQRVRGPVVAARAVSELVRFDRVEGLALGAGFSRQLGGGMIAAVRGRWGFDDRALKGALDLRWQRASGRGAGLFARRELGEAGDAAERSGVANTVAAQEFGSDYTDPFREDAAGLRADLGTLPGAPGGFLWRVEGAYERHDAAAVHARPAQGRFEPTLPVRRSEGPSLTLSLDRPTTLSFLGTEVSLAAAARGYWVQRWGPAIAPGGGTASSPSTVRRASLVARVERPFASSPVRRLVLHTVAAAAGASRDLPLEEAVYFGGPVTGPGYELHSLSGRWGVSQRVEWRMPVPFVSVPLGRFGRVPGSATLAPYAHVVVTGQALLPGAREGAHPSLGVGLLTLFDLLRIDVARGLRGGRWQLGLDVSREFWRVL